MNLTNAINMLSNPIAIYIGMGLCFLFLFITSLQQKHSFRVFFILLLRLAIGWHFLFEGLHKIHTYSIGPTDTNKPFTSEPYFTLADGPLGPLVRAQIGDSAQVIKLRIIPKKFPVDVKANESAENLIKLIPDPVVNDWEQYVKLFSRVYLKSDTPSPEVKKISDDLLAKYGRWIVGLTPGKESKIRYVQTDVPFNVPQRLAHISKLETVMEELSERTQVKLGYGNGTDIKHVTASKNELKSARDELVADADSVIADMKKELFTLTIGKEVTALGQPSAMLLKDEAAFKELVSFAPVAKPATFDASVPPALKSFWNKYYDKVVAVYPLNDKPDSDRWQTGSEKSRVDGAAEYWKLALAEWFTAKDGWISAKAKYEAGIKSGKKEDIEKAKTALVGEIDKQFGNFKSSITKMLPADSASGVVPTPVEKPIQKIDYYTMYFITIVGACLFFGVLTRISCLLAVGFLVMTYLTHPPFPWLPLPPNTEGNPLYINKNVIEALALLVIAVHPTGRWLGLDALLYRICFGRKPFDKE
ncbi:MAG: hypothetical protein U0798_19715 [Gemmataceae bacterium]